MCAKSAVSAIPSRSELYPNIQILNISEQLHGFLLSCLLTPLSRDDKTSGGTVPSTDFYSSCPLFSLLEDKTSGVTVPSMQPFFKTGNSAYPSDIERPRPYFLGFQVRERVG